MNITKYICSFLQVLLFLLLPASVKAQNNTATDEMYLLEIQSHLQAFLDEWKGLTSDIQFAGYDYLPDMENRMKQLDAKWLTYSQAQQMDIAANDSLLEIVGNIQVAKQAAQKVFDQKKAEQQMMTNFKNAEIFLSGKDTMYRHMVKMAEKMALAKPLAAKLEKLKAKEQLIFTEIQTHYDAAKQAAEAFPDLQERMGKLEERYIALKSASTKVQAAIYKPWITRVKDYLLGMAAVAMILMFLNMLSSKIKAVKQARKSAQELQKMMQNNNNAQQYPTI